MRWYKVLCQKQLSTLLGMMFELLQTINIVQDKLLGQRLHAVYHIYCNLSLSMVVLNSRDRQGMYGIQHFRTPKNPPYKRL